MVMNGRGRMTLNISHNYKDVEQLSFDFIGCNREGKIRLYVPLDEVDSLSCMIDSFCWADTLQGEDYWEEVYSKICEMEYGSRPHPYFNRTPLLYDGGHVGAMSGVLNNAFQWSSTPEGYDYWFKVSDDLSYVERNLRK